MAVALVHAITWLYVVGTLVAQGDIIGKHAESPLLVGIMWTQGAPLIFATDIWMAVFSPIIGDIPAVILEAAVNGLIWGVAAAWLVSRWKRRRVSPRRAAA